jgi:hypothetical protein
MKNKPFLFLDDCDFPKPLEPTVPEMRGPVQDAQWLIADLDRCTEVGRIFLMGYLNRWMEPIRSDSAKTLFARLFWDNNAQINAQKLREFLIQRGHESTAWMCRVKVQVAGLLHVLERENVDGIYMQAERRAA